MRYLQDDPRQSASELDIRLGMTPGTAWRRLERLKERGILHGVRGEIDWTRLGYAVEVSLRITLDKTQNRAFEEFIDAARAVPEITEIQTFLGRVDVRLLLVARDMSHYQQIYRNDIMGLPHIADIEALMQVAAIKRGGSLPI